MYKRKLHKEISNGLLVLIVAFSLTGCGSSRDALEISDTESAQAEEVGQENATATPATSQTIPETTTEPESENLPDRTISGENPGGSGLGGYCPGTAGRGIWRAVLFL